YRNGATIAAHVGIVTSAAFVLAGDGDGHDWLLIATVVNVVVGVSVESAGAVTSAGNKLIDREAAGVAVANEFFGSRGRAAGREFLRNLVHGVRYVTGRRLV